MNTLIFVSVDELWLKGKNRRLYVKAITEHISKVLKAYMPAKFEIRNENQRLAIFLSGDVDETNLAKTVEALTRVPGIFTVSVSHACAKDLQVMGELGINLFNKLQKEGKFPKSFKVVSTRTDKRFPVTTPEINIEVGGIIFLHFESLGLKVDLHKPELVLDIRILNDSAYLSTEVYPGMGGLPVGTSGHVVTMLSGGLDSPVASYLMSKRGCSQVFVFFFAYPFVGDEVKDKIVKLCSQLAKFQSRTQLYIIPFGAVQQQIGQACHSEYRTILFRAYMIKVANMLAKKIDAEAICTGDSLGQVSSQTLTNMALVDRVSERIVLRPLLGHNKREIIDQARKIGTYETSILPYDDACSLFAPKKPIIRGDLGYFTKFIEENSFDQLLNQAILDAEIYRFQVDGKILE